jgi:Zn-dependent peptidase ImmA (M78 family)/predicted secreted protein
MPNWRSAHRIAMFAAEKAHAAYKVDTSTRIDVFQIVDDAGIILAFQPMQKLAGAVVFEPGAVGIVINSNHPPSRQRYTAAHEFGHFFMRHGSYIDATHDIFRGGRDGGPPSEKEMLAEAFAAWFLMPRELVRASLEQMGVTRLNAPDEVYELSLRLGTSYESTILHANNLQLLPRGVSRSWLRQKPASLKKMIAGSYVPEALRNDVWAVGEGDNNRELVVRCGDRLLVTLEEVPSSGWRWRPRQEPRHAQLIAKYYSHDSLHESDSDPVGSPVERTFVYEIPSGGFADTISLVNGPSWREVVGKRFDLQYSVEREHLRGLSEDYFMLGGTQH